MYDTSPEPSPRIEVSELAGLELQSLNPVSADDPQIPSGPVLRHTLYSSEASVLSVAADAHYIYAGAQTGQIFVWEKTYLKLKTTLTGHTGSVLTLETYQEKSWLFSASGDSTIRIWSTITLTPLYTIVPHVDSDAGDIFSLTYSPSLSTVYFGCQNTSIQWLDLSQAISPPGTASGSKPFTEGITTPGTPGKRFHKFFDSVPQSQRNIALLATTPMSTRPLSLSSTNNASEFGVPELQVSAENVIPSAHYGYVYCMALSPSHLFDGDPLKEGEDVYLLTGSGDEDVKIWEATRDGLTHKYTFTGCDSGVLSLVVRNGTIYAGCQGGHIKVWDLETKTLIRTLIADSPPESAGTGASADILSLSIIGGVLYACMGNGWCQSWSSNFQSIGFWKAHDGIVLSSVGTLPAGQVESSSTVLFATGGADANIQLWSVEVPSGSRRPQIRAGTLKAENDLQAALAEFVGIPSVVNVEACKESCRQAALWLKNLLSQLGAEASLLTADSGINPLVLATFRGNEERKDRPRVLFYGHYDVIPARKHGWDSDPFTLSGRDGYLYGRGVSDNKGPILAAAFAISELRRKVALGLDIVMLIEGEEEAGSRGFEYIVRRHKDLVGPVDAILISNSYWIGEEVPCITYGLRGVIHARVEVSNSQPDLHSGVEGGGLVEPMFDMVSILSKLSSGGKVFIPHFYEDVRQQTEEEQELYRLLERMTGKPASYLTAKWREPSLSIHSLETSGPGNRTVIPSSVTAALSFRIVPDQKLAEIATSVERHILDSFAELKSPNSIHVTIEKAADWWLGNLEGPWFQALESAIENEWGVRPLRIREGGSIPSIPFLEKIFGCPALHLPLGQSTDQAHLANERISVNNLLKGKAVLERFFLSVASMEKNV